MFVRCPKCTRHYEVAEDRMGKTSTCPGCGTLARIPWPDEPPVDPSPGVYSPYASPQVSAHAPGDGESDRRRAAERFEVHRRVAGILGIVMGGLSLLAAVFMFATTASITANGLPAGVEFPRGPGAPSIEMVAAVYAVCGALCLVTGVLQILSGIALLARRRSARVLGIATAVTSCMSLWVCCFYPFSLGFGIYLLVTLSTRAAMDVLNR